MGRKICVRQDNRRRDSVINGVIMWTDRVEAGRELAARLADFGKEKTVVLGIPRGGMVVAAEVARALDAPLGYVIARKIGAPGNPEFGIGAVDADGETILDLPAVAATGADAAYIERARVAQTAEIARRAKFLGDNKAASRLSGKTVLVVDDGVATGVTTRAAIRFLKRKKATAVILAAPVAPSDTAVMLMKEADEVVILQTPAPFGSVGAWYYDFTQVEDNEVKQILAEFGS